MSDPYMGEIRLFAFPRTPDSWLACNGQLVSIAEYDALYTLLGTTYGGDGVNTFGLPDLRGRVPIGAGTGQGQPTYVLGEMAGTEQVTLTRSEMAAHGHALVSTVNTATTATPGPSVHLATDNAGNLYAPVADAAPYALLAASIGQTGGNVAHDNMMPSLVGNFCICAFGIYPQGN